MKRYILWILGMITLLAVCLLGNVISLGDRIMMSSPVLGWMFYVLVCVLFFGLLLFPMLRIVFTPEITGMETVSEEVHEQMRDKVLSSAKVSLLMTTVSQNGSIDVLANGVIAIRMIDGLVKTAGVRPTLPQLAKLYSSVLTTSLIVASVDDVLDNLDISGMIGNAGVGAICKLFQPLANGAANAYMCLRVGYATMRYLEIGGKAYEEVKPEVRKEAAKQARKDLVPVMKSEMSDIIARVK